MLSMLCKRGTPFKIPPLFFPYVSHEKALFLLDHLSGARMSLSRTIVKKSNKKGYYYEFL